jgi:hypothetical protein
MQDLKDPFLAPERRTPVTALAFIKAIKNWGSLSHIFSIVVCILIAVTLLPAAKSGLTGLKLADAQLIEQRQLLLEALDKMARYEHYHREVHGRFTRDIARLGVPTTLSQGDLNSLRNIYEISVLEASENRVLILATGNSDRVTIDERHRVNANFILPPPSRAYLLEEADRILHLYAKGQGRIDSVYANYWKLESHIEADGPSWQAIGQKHPVQGERRQMAQLQNEGGRKVASIFNDVGNKVRAHWDSLQKPTDPKLVRPPTGNEVRLLLQRVHQAQHIFKRERGAYASSWDELSAASSLDVQGQYKGSLKISAIEILSTGYRVSAEGTRGELLGEQFVLDQSGQVKQIRYTQSIINSLKESAEILQGALPFQISEVGGDGPSNLDSKKPGTVQLRSRGSDALSTE